jgi:hypothetical protein
MILGTWKLHEVTPGARFQALSENGRLRNTTMKLAIFWQEDADLSPLFLDNRV